jgi:two-component system nitrogen regulation response regulator NtrX
LNVIPFYVPPLRERKEDIPLLARHFLKEFRYLQPPPARDHDDAIDTLMRYSWPGNVRELRNVIERIVIMNPTATRFDRKHLPPLVYREGGRRATARREFSTLHQARAAYERDYILKKLDENHGNVTRAAEVLGLERSHLYRKMKALGMGSRTMIRIPRCSSQATRHSTTLLGSSFAP